MPSNPIVEHFDVLKARLLCLSSRGIRMLTGQFPSTPLQRWVYFIRVAGAEDEVMKKIKEQEPMIARADEKYRSFLNVR